MRIKIDITEYKYRWKVIWVRTVDGKRFLESNDSSIPGTYLG